MILTICHSFLNKICLRDKWLITYHSLLFHNNRKIKVSGVWNHWAHNVHYLQIDQINVCILASAQLLCFIFSVQDPKLKELSWPQWIKANKNIQKPCPEAQLSDNYRFCQIEILSHCQSRLNHITCYFHKHSNYIWKFQQNFIIKSAQGM